MWSPITYESIILHKKLHNEFTKSLSLTKGEKEGKEVSGVLAKIIKMVDN